MDNPKYILSKMSMYIKKNFKCSEVNIKTFLYNIEECKFDGMVCYLNKEKTICLLIKPRLWRHSIFLCEQKDMSEFLDKSYGAVMQEKEISYGEAIELIKLIMRRYKIMKIMKTSQDKIEHYLNLKLVKNEEF